MGDGKGFLAEILQMPKVTVDGNQKSGKKSTWDAKKSCK